jgi:membrane protein YqaA with SNARE-associated domain
LLKKEVIDFAAAVSAALIFFFISLIIPYDALGPFGYIGAFLMALISSATILLPGTILPIIAVMGAHYSPVILGLACGIGSALGELTGYYAGYYGRSTLNLKSLPEFEKQKAWLKGSEFLFLFLLAFIPNPIFDIAGIAAGTIKIPVQRFLLPVFIGKALKYGLTAYLGLSAWNWIVLNGLFG